MPIQRDGLPELIHGPSRRHLTLENIQLIQEFKNANNYRVKAVKQRADKAMRLHMQAAFIEAGGSGITGTGTPG